MLVPFFGFSVCRTDKLCGLVCFFDGLSCKPQSISSKATTMLRVEVYDPEVGGYFPVSYWFASTSRNPAALPINALSLHTDTQTHTDTHNTHARNAQRTHTTHTRNARTAHTCIHVFFLTSPPPVVFFCCWCRPQSQSGRPTLPLSSTTTSARTRLLPRQNCSTKSHQADTKQTSLCLTLSCPSSACLLLCLFVLLWCCHSWRQPETVPLGHVRMTPPHEDLRPFQNQQVDVSRARARCPRFTAASPPHRSSHGQTMTIAPPTPPPNNNKNNKKEIVFPLLLP